MMKNLLLILLLFVIVLHFDVFASYTRNLHKNFLRGKGVVIFILLIFFVFSLSAATYYTRGGGGDWSDVNTWSTAACNGAVAGTIPGAGDDVEICQSTVNIDGAYTCNNLTVGSQNAITLLQVTGANSLTVNGDLKINTGNNGNTYTLDAGAGIININGTFSYWATNGDNYIKVSTGTINFTPFVNLSNDAHYIEFTGAGTINFNAGFTNTRSQTRFITVAGCTAKFGGTYTQTTNNITWDTDATAVFDCVGCLIDNSVSVDLGHTVIEDNASVSTAGAGNLNPTGDLTIKTNATFNATKNLPGNISTVRNINNVTLYAGSAFNLGGTGTYIQVSGNWVNNGGALNGGTYEVRFEGIGNSIGGTSSTTFPDLRFGNTLNNVYYTLSQNITCANLILDANNSSRTIAHDASNPALTVTGNATINQPTGAFTNLWDISGGTGTVSGDLIFSGTSNTTTRIGKINVSSGTFTLNGNVTWMAGQATPQAVATEVISLGSGTMNFANSLTMGQGSGTFNVTGAGTVNFNGAAAPSFYLNSTVAGNTTNAVFSNSFGSFINFNNGFRNANVAVILADGSTAVFTANGTIIPTAAITFGNVQINAGVTATLAGSISVTNNWTNLGGTLTPGTNTVTFNGTATQTITKAGGEIFYNLTTNTTGPLTLANDATVTNQITMTAGDYNLNGNTMTLGNAAASTLSRTAGIMYEGVFKRWCPTVAITSANYGLFPVGSSTDYRPVAINSTANPTTAGYVLCRHYDAISVTNLGPYVDNEGSSIQRKHDMYDEMSISGLAGGTYNIDVSFSGLSTVGVLTDMKLITYTGGVAGSVGTSAATTGTASSPTVKRTSLTAANLQNDWIVGTKDKSATPLRPPYYSRKTGNWNDATVGDATWSLFPQVPGPQPSCDCVPTTDALVYISSSDVVSVTAAATCDYIIAEDAAILDGTANFTVNIDLLTLISGKIAPTTGTWLISRNATLGSSSASSSPSTAITIKGTLTIPAGASLTQNVGMTVSGNLVVDGTLAAGTNNISLNGLAKTISGTGTITGSGTLTTTTNKSILFGTTLSIVPNFNIAAASTVTNNGDITLSGNLTGVNATTSIWTNAANSTLNAAGTVLSTGVLNASASPNTVNYNGAGAQTVKVPSASTYYNLINSNAGTKTAGGNIIVSNLLTVQDAAILDDNTSSITGGGGLTMSGTSRYIISNSATVPALSGTYNLTSGTIQFNWGIQTVRSSGLNGPGTAAYYDVNFSNSNTKTLAGPITVQNDLSITNTARLDVSASNYSINLKGDWTVTSTNANPFNERSGTVTLSGAVQQSISTVLAAGETFYNLTVNNSTPASAILLTNNVTVSNTLDLTDGHILTSPIGTGLLTMSANAFVSLNSTPQDSSFVKGKLASIISGNASVTKIFPIGKDNDYRRIDLTIDHQPNATVTYTAEMINSSATSFGYTIPGSLTHVSAQRYYEIISSSPTTNLDNAIVYLNYQCTQKDDDVQDLPNLKIAQWDGASAWVDIGGIAAGAVCSGSNYAGNIFSNNFSINEFTGYRFALANGLGGVNPLPIELISFDAVLKNKRVELFWVTANEINNEFFTIEKTKDGENFIEVAQVKGAGNSSSIKEYNTIDKNPYSGISYYRLKQTDFDGKYTYSELIAINNPEGKEMMFTVFPNPSDGANINISLTGYTNNEEVLVVLHDIDGRMVFSKIFLTDDNGAFLTGVDPQKNLPPGIYLVVGSTRNDIYSRKLIIK